MSALWKGLQLFSGIMGVALALIAIINEFYIYKKNIYTIRLKESVRVKVKNAQKHSDIMLHCNRG